jgi:hypothetical protein
MISILDMIKKQVSRALLMGGHPTHPSAKYQQPLVSKRSLAGRFQPAAATLPARSGDICAFDRASPALTTSPTSHAAFLQLKLGNPWARAAARNHAQIFSGEATISNSLRTWIGLFCGANLFGHCISDFTSQSCEHECCAP